MKASVYSNQRISGPYFKIIIEPVQNISFVPGQFVMIRPADSASSGIFLPRPFSIYSLTDENHLGILYKVAGRGTEFLSSLVAGSEIGFLGPFGNGFAIDDVNLPDEFFIVAGGIGVAPLLCLLELLRERCPEVPVTAFIGGRKSSDLLCTDEFEKLGATIVAATEDGSAGLSGYVTDALEGRLRNAGGNRKFRLYACGPNPMLRRIYDIAGPSNIESYFSLEAVMACGMGLCMGCAVRKRGGGYLLVCKDGPVFKGDIIEFADDETGF